MQFNSLLKGYYRACLKIGDFTKAFNANTECNLLPTNLPTENWHLLKQEKIDLVLIQSNGAIKAAEGTSHFIGQKPIIGLHPLLTLHDKAFIVNAKDNTEIKVLANINDKKISNAGHFRAASKITYNLLQIFYSLVKKPIDAELKTKDYATELCNRNIDMIMLKIALPNALVANIAADRHVGLVDIGHDKLNKFAASHKNCHILPVLKEFCPDITYDQPQSGLSTILGSINKLDTTILENFINYCHSNMAKFKQANLVLNKLTNNYFSSNFPLLQQGSFNH